MTDTSDEQYDLSVYGSSILDEPDEDEAGPRLELIRPDLETPIKPVRYIADRILPREYACLLTGHGGAGKSSLSDVLIAHAACGRAFGDIPFTQTRCLMVSLEDPADVVRSRLRRICAHYDLPVSVIDEQVMIADGSDGATLAIEHSEFGMHRLIPTAVYDDLKALAEGYGFIVIDNASDAYDANENSRRMVRAFIRLLNNLARDNDASVMLLAHVDKAAARYGAAGNSYSGSTAWHNSVRSRLALVEVEGRIELRHEKCNLGPRIEPVQLQWSDHGVLVLVSPTESSQRDHEDEMAVLAAIKAAILDGESVPANRTGPANTHRLLASYPDLPEPLINDKSRFWRAITRLERASYIEKEPYKDDNRKQKTRWICASSGAQVSPPIPP